MVLGGCAPSPPLATRTPVETREPLPDPGWRESGVITPEPGPEIQVLPDLSPLPEPVPLEPPPADYREPAASPAVVALLDQARNQARVGEGEQAAASLERALRIEPRNPWLWHRLAVLRLQQRYWDQAVDLANRSNSLAAGNPRLLGGNWQVIAEALAARGDASGAAQARERSRSYFRQAGQP